MSPVSAGKAVYAVEKDYLRAAIMYITTGCGMNYDAIVLTDVYYDKTLFFMNYIPLVFLDINEVVKKLTDVNQWFSLGIQLSVPIADLKKIDINYSDLDRKKAEMLFKWQRLGKGVSWQSLIRALNGIEEIGLARTLASQLGKQSVSQSLT